MNEKEIDDPELSSYPSENLDNRLNLIDLGKSAQSETFLNRTKGSTNFRISKETLMSLENQNSGYRGFIDTEELLMNHMHFVFEVRAIFIGAQKWEHDPIEEPLVDIHNRSLQVLDQGKEKPKEPKGLNLAINIQRFDIDELQAYTKVEADLHSLFKPANNGRFLEILQWNKRKTINDGSDEGVGKLVIKQKWSVFIDELKLLVNLDIIKAISAIVEEIANCHLKFTPMYKKSIEILVSALPSSTSSSIPAQMTKGSLDDKKPSEAMKKTQSTELKSSVRFNLTKLSVVLSENSVSDEALSNIDDDLLANGTSSSQMYKESTRYDYGLSEIASMVSSSLALSKSKAEETIDLVCFEVRNFTVRVTMEPEIDQIDDANLMRLGELLKTPETKCTFETRLYGFNIGDGSITPFVYPVRVSVVQDTRFETFEKKLKLVKMLALKFSAIEAEASVNILLSIWDQKIKPIVELSQEKAMKLIGLFATEQMDVVAQPSTEPLVHKKRIGNHEICYLIEVKMNHIYVTVLKENRKIKSPFRYLPLWSIEATSTKVECCFEVVVPIPKHTFKEGKLNDQIALLINCEIERKRFELLTTFTLSYFNFKLNYYEPLLEPFNILVWYRSDQETKSLITEIDEITVLNINLSTALLENLVISVNYYNESMAKYGYAEKMVQSNQTKREINNLEMVQSNYDYHYSLENLTGEEVLVSTHEDQDFLSVYASQMMVLDFAAKQNELAPTESQQKVSGKGTNSELRSPFRKENFKVEHSYDQRTKKIFLHIPSLMLDDSVFTENKDIEKLAIDINKLEQQKCMKIYINEDKASYLLCHEQVTGNDQNRIILRSPIQIKNTLKIPIEIKLEKDETQNSEETKVQQNEFLKRKSDSKEFKMHIEADSSTIVPMRMMQFNIFSLRPARPVSGTVCSTKKEEDYGEIDALSPYDWSNTIHYDLHNRTEKELFETKPEILECQYNKDSNDGADMSSVYIGTSITTKTLSMNNSIRFISINAPFTIVNSLPFDLRMFFNATIMEEFENLADQNPNLADLIASLEDTPLLQKKPVSGPTRMGKKRRLKEKLNVIEEDQDESCSNSEVEEETTFFDAVGQVDIPKQYPFIDLRSCEEASLLDTKPDLNMFVSVQPPMYRASNFLNIKNNLNDFEEEVPQPDDLSEEEEQLRLLVETLKKTCDFRFLKKRTFMFQVTKLNNASSWHSPLNVCCDVTTIHGFFKLHFYTKYWFVNNTELPLSLKFTERDYEYQEIRLPYANENETKNEEMKQPARSHQKELKHYSEVSQLNPWNKYKLYQQSYQGLLMHHSGSILDSFMSQIDMEYEFGISNIPDEFEESDEEEVKEPLQVVEITPKLQPNNNLDTKKSMILNEKHVFPISSKSETTLIRTFSTLSDVPKNDSTHLLLRIASCNWNMHKFDISKLQKAPININGRGFKDNLNCEYSICSNFKYLPYPFSKTTLVTFAPKYKVFNKCKAPVFVYQSDCHGSMCLYPGQKSTFHWSDAGKAKEMRVRYDEYEISGPFKVDKIDEIGIRVKKNNDHEIKIVKVCITEIGSTYLIEFLDEGFTPPYRLENMTKYDLILGQSNSKQEDFDTLQSYQIKNYALSSPLSDKVLKINLKAHGNLAHMTDIRLDSFKNNEKVIIIDKKHKTSFVILINLENSMKVIRIQEQYEFEYENVNKEDELQQRGLTLEFKIPKLGFSLINSATAEEIVYIYFKDIDICMEKTHRFEKFKIDILAIQVDDQMAPPDNCIVMKKDGGRGQSLIRLNYCLINNQGFEHIIHYKEFNFELYPIELFLNGTF